MSEPQNPPGFTKSELSQLYNLACSHCLGRNKFNVVYRTKTKSYWDAICETENRIMEKYEKSDCGHPRNNVNGVLKGLFFTPNTCGDFVLPSSSPYGDQRLILPAEQLLDPTKVNLYFCDFYCFGFNALLSDAPHHLTIIICHKDSNSDDFCKEKLIPLPKDNPFLRIHNVDGGYQFEVSGTIWIELCYTENLQVDPEKLVEVSPRGLGYSTPGGIANNPNCKKCNLREWRKKDTDKKICDTCGSKMS
uniref:PHYHIP_C domain-containing protein n=1 Tax=Panagrellus redivivus TaxID=6233 RepID=A0A7E4V4H8_PANRE